MNEQEPTKEDNKGCLLELKQVLEKFAGDVVSSMVFRDTFDGWDEEWKSYPYTGKENKEE